MARGNERDRPCNLTRQHDTPPLGGIICVVSSTSIKVPEVSRDLWPMAETRPPSLTRRNRPRPQSGTPTHAACEWIARGLVRGLRSGDARGGKGGGANPDRPDGRAAAERRGGRQQGLCVAADTPHRTATEHGRRGAEAANYNNLEAEGGRARRGGGKSGRSGGGETGAMRGPCAERRPPHNPREPRRTPSRQRPPPR